MKAIANFCMYFLLTGIAVVATEKPEANAQVSGTFTIPGNFPTITAALTQINSVGLSGPTILELQIGYTSAGETFPIYLENISGSNSINTLTIRPAIGATGLILSGTANGTIGFMNASYVTIDGRPGGLGTAREISIVNTTPFLSAVQFADGSNNNSVQYCTLIGNNATLYGGVVYFAGSSNTATGNIQNTIASCVIRDASGGVPCNGIYSAGSPTLPNSGNSIINNEILNFSHAGIHISPDGNGGNWTITGNSFYNNLQTPPSTAQTAIYFEPGPGSDGNIIDGNFIGGQGVNATGAKWTNTGDVTFTGIYLSAGTSSGITAHNNIVQNIALTSGGANTNFTGISIASGITVNNGNTIGSATAANSITVSGNSSIVTGILVNSSAAVSVTGDDIGNISVSGVGANIFGIYYAGGSAVNITDNIIHDFSSNHTDDVNFTGVYVAGGGITSSLLHDNTVQKIYLTSASAIQFTGISIASGIINNNGNTIGSATEANSIMLSGSSSSARGILIGSSAAVSVTGDNIGNISIVGGEAYIVGVLYTGGAAVTITENFIHDLSANNTGIIEFTGVYIGGGGVTPSLFHENTVQNISLTSSLFIKCTGTDFASGITVNSGNIIGSATDANSIMVSAPSSIVTGMLVGSSSGVTVSHDIIGGIGVSGNNAIVNGIFVNTSAGSAIVTLDSNIVIGNNIGAGINALASGAGILNITVSGNRVNNWEKGIVLSKDAGALLQPSIHNNVIEGNEIGFDNQSGLLQDATCNWWGDASGPSGAGPGTGDAVSTNVLFSPWSTIPTFVSVDAGTDQTIYIGYGSQSKTLTATAIACGGTGYLWSTGSTSASIIVSPTVTTNYSVTVTDAAGRTATDIVTVFVQDVRCEKNKVLVCHKGVTICINIRDVQSHFSHGDVLGACVNDGIVSKLGSWEEVEDISLLQNYPNPFSSKTTFHYSIKQRSQVTIKILDQLGREVSALLKAEKESGHHYWEYEPDNDLPTGVYFCLLIVKSEGNLEKRIMKKLVLIR